MSTGITVAGGNETSLPQSLRHAFSPPKQLPQPLDPLSCVPDSLDLSSSLSAASPCCFPLSPPYSQLISTSYPLVAGTPTARNDSCGGPALGKLFLLSSQLNFRRSVGPVSSSLLQFSLAFSHATTIALKFTATLPSYSRELSC